MVSLSLLHGLGVGVGALAFLAGHVRGITAGVRESFMTEVALEGLVSSVYPDVLLQL